MQEQTLGGKTRAKDDHDSPVARPGLAESQHLVQDTKTVADDMFPNCRRTSRENARSSSTSPRARSITRRPAE